MIILDTNMLLVPGQFGVDVITQAKEIDKDLSILEGTKKELEKIKNSGKRDSGNARVGLKLIERNNIKILKEGEGSTVDDKIVNCAKENSHKVATNDKDLINRLKNKKIKIIRLRQKKYLVEG